MNKSARRIFIEFLTANWQTVRSEAAPDSAKSRDEQFVWKRIRGGRSEDIRHILETIPQDGVPFEEQPLVLSWMVYHLDWVRGEVPSIIAMAVNDLRDMKRDRRAAKRKQRRYLKRNGRRQWIKPVGRPPSLSVAPQKLLVTPLAPAK